MKVDQGCRLHDLFKKKPINCVNYFNTYTLTISNFLNTGSWPSTDHLIAVVASRHKVFRIWEHLWKFTSVLQVAPLISSHPGPVGTCLVFVAYSCAIFPRTCMNPSINIICLDIWKFIGVRGAIHSYLRTRQLYIFFPHRWCKSN